MAGANGEETRPPFDAPPSRPATAQSPQAITRTIDPFIRLTDLVRYYSYDARGNLTRKIDRNGRVIDYAYDSLSRLTTETWYDDVTDADAQQDAVTTYSTTYDRVGRVATIGDGEYDFEYTWSIFGNLTSTTQDLTGLSDDVVFNYTYDVLGRQTSVAAAVGSTDDYVNTYSYDNLGRITQITQDGVSGGNAVAEKRVDYAYNDDSTRATISRYADLAGTTAVAETEKVFDELGRVTDIVHERAATEFADYDLTWDAAGELTDFDFASLVGDDGETSYTYDDTGQLTAADYASDWQEDESYVYDDNGNRTLVDGTTTYTTGDHNRLTSDDTYNYTYDGEGNVHTKTTIATGESVEYTWDHRNRLTKVTFKNSGGTATKIVEYAYDYGQRWVRKTLDTDADGTIEESQIFVHDSGQIVLDFEKTGTADAGNSDLAHRYLWGGSVDDLLADESVDDGTADDVAWALTDHLHSVRDVVVYDPTTQTVSIVKHVTYDAYGNVTSDTATTVDTLFLYTARPFDADTELQNNRARWYDATTGRWLSTDPIGFTAGDVNLYRYVGNVVVRFVDPRGLQPPAAIQSPVEPSRPISDIMNPGMDWPSIIANPGGFFPPIITNPGHAIDDWWEDIKDKADGVYDDITNGIEDDWVEHAPGWDYSNDIEFLYAFGSHKWEVDTNCCGTDEFGLCTENKLHSEGRVECTFVAPVPLFDISAQAISAFAGMVAEVGGQFQYELDAFANAAVSPNGGSSSTGLTCDVDTKWKSSVTIGGGILVEDGDYSGIDLVVLPGLTVGAGPDGVDWNSDNFFGIHYVRDFMGGKIDLRGGCTLKGDKDAWDVDFGLEFDVAF